MGTLTIRLPDETAERLKTLARSRKLSVDKWRWSPLELALQPSATCGREAAAGPRARHDQDHAVDASNAARYYEA
jgi:hypothetical protein